MEMDKFSTRGQDPYEMTDEKREFIRKEIFPYQDGKSLEDKFLKRVPKYTAKILINTGIIDNDSKWRQAVGEVTPYYEDILFPKGYNKIKEEALEKIELLTYHMLGIDKYKNLGLDDYIYKYEVPSNEVMKELEDIVKSCDVEVLKYKQPQ